MRQLSWNRVLPATVLGIAVLVGFVCIASRALDEKQAIYEGLSAEQWRNEFNFGGARSNRAFLVITRFIIPALLERAFGDYGESHLRVAFAGYLNSIPGIEIHCPDAVGRRCDAVAELGAFGPAARTAVPDLVRIVKGANFNARAPAIMSLGEIHSDPEVVVPLLIECLKIDQLAANAAHALSAYGSQARAAVPALIAILKHRETSVRSAASEALLKIDQKAAESAGVLPGKPPLSRNR
jgi:hypothetical protein